MKLGKISCHLMVSFGLVQNSEILDWAMAKVVKVNISVPYFENMNYGSS
jgi:hypothetical protein